MVAEKNKWKLNRNGIIAVAGLVVLIIIILYFSLRDGSEIDYSPPFDSGANEENIPDTEPETPALAVLQRMTVFKAGSGQGAVTSSPPGINCGEDCTQDFTNGSSVTLQATARSGSRLESWSGACAGVTADRCTVTMNRARSVIVNFGSQTQETRPQVIVSKDGSGTGRITSSPAGIDCGSDCSESYSNGTEVELTATANAGSIFSGWHGACTGTGTCRARVRGTINLIATFSTTETSHRLTVNRAGDGFGSIGSTPTGINCGNLDGDIDCTEDYLAGTSVTLNPLAGPDTTFTGWSGDCAGLDSCTLIMGGARTATATFEVTEAAETFLLSTSKTGSGSGTLTSSPAGINCGADCSEAYLRNTEVTISHVSAAGSIFTGWSGDCSGMDPCRVTMNSAKTVAANFNRVHTVSISRIGTGSGTVTSSPGGINCGAACSSLFEQETPLRLSASPDPESQFVSWSGCDMVLFGACQLTVDRDREIYAKFKLRDYSLTVTKMGEGNGVIISEPTGINCGAACWSFFSRNGIVILQPTSDADSEFVSWEGCDAVSGDDLCQVLMNTDRNVFATFRLR